MNLVLAFAMSLLVIPPGTVSGVYSIAAPYSHGCEGIYIDKTYLASRCQPPYTVPWDTRKVSNGAHRIVVRHLGHVINSTTVDVEN